MHTCMRLPPQTHTHTHTHAYIQMHLIQHTNVAVYARVQTQPSVNIASPPPDELRHQRPLIGSSFNSSCSVLSCDSFALQSSPP